MVILVAGSTGFVGADIALKLKQRGHNVLALARGGRLHPKSQRLLDAGVEVLDGDLTRPDTLLAACSGVETVVTTATSMPSGADDGLHRVDHNGTLALVDAAERQGVRRFIYTSYSGNIQEDCPLGTAKRDCETRLLTGPMEAVILRPSYFMEAWLSPALGFDPLGGSARICGSGEARVSYISAFDVADFAVAAAAKTYPQKNVVLEMGGPQPLSQLEAVLLFEQALGKEIKLDHIPVEALRAQHQSSDPLQKTFAALMLSYAAGDVIDDAISNALLHGIKLSSVADYASRFHANAAVAGS
jgi:NADH dehydrogenase